MVTWPLTSSVKSLVNIMKNSGPKILPRGTSTRAWRATHDSQSNKITCFLSNKYKWHQLNHNIYFNTILMFIMLRQKWQNFIIQIHQFSIKIDKINITLLFECVKIVEFNFNSHVFHVMYQETRFLNQDACFLNQEGRRQFLISFVSERDWNRAHRLEFKV